MKIGKQRVLILVLIGKVKLFIFDDNEIQLNKTV